VQDENESAAADSASRRTAVAIDRPSVSVLVLNQDRQSFLHDCFASLEAQEYPRERFEVVLVDTGSTDDSTAFVTRKFPRTRVFRWRSNQGFGAPYNAAIQSCQTQFVALVNNDARVDAGWLAALVSAAHRHDAVAVASTILDWSGETVESAQGALSLLGHPCQTNRRGSANRSDEERRLLFACAGSALYSRAALLEAGGFDEDFFECLEDADLGWRLNLFGGNVVLAPKAVTYQRSSETSTQRSVTQQLRLVERNALSMIYKNYEAATLERVLPAAIALLLLRASMRSGIDSLTLALSDRPREVIDTQPHLAASLIALEDFCRQLPQIRRKRDVVQQRRRHSDAALFELFGDPLHLGESQGLYVKVASALIREFGIDELVSPVRKARSRQTATSPPGQPQRHQLSPSARLPRVSIVILTALGATHLRECLDSLLQQDYPLDRTELIVVDNASAEDPTSEVRARFPNARVIRNEKNVGFAGGNNQGVAASTGEYVIFLNDDTRVNPHWLRELVETARRRNAAAVASYILDWSGTKVDFVDGAVNFQGKGFQLEYGVAANRLTPEEKPLLFACGCAMLMDRTTLEEAGGWDEGMFAYYEDVELGWRLHVLGHEVWLAPRAVVYHKHHGTSGAWPEPPRTRLYERNSLRGLFCLLDSPSLRRALPAALLLAADRALLESGLSRAAEVTLAPIHRRLRVAARTALRARGVSRSTTIRQAIGLVWRQGPVRLGKEVLRLAAGDPRSRRESYLIERRVMSRSFDVQPQPMPIAAAAMLSGIYGFLSEIPQLAERRERVQRQRRVDDGDLLQRFGTHWLAPSNSRLQAEHHAIHTAIADEFGIAAIGPYREPDHDVRAPSAVVLP
jgi:GT2 family glycosyltransferase